MWKRLLIGSIAITISLGGIPGQAYDTLYTRGQGYILCPKNDTLQQLELASDKADTILGELAKIMDKLNISDTIK